MINKAFGKIKSNIRKNIHRVFCVKKINEINDTKEIESKDSYVSESIWDNSMEQFQKGNFKIYWELLPAIEKYQMNYISEDESIDLISYIIECIKKNIGAYNLKGLSIGCNVACPEMTIFRTGLFDKIEVMDIAEGLLNKQKKAALEMGLDDIEYIKQDFNTAVFDKDAYDVIWAIGTIHHIEKLETFFNQINNALKDGGIFIMREYIGPNRMQFTDMQLRIVNDILSILPEKYRIKADGTIKHVVNRPDVDDLIEADPSESVRSQDIMAIIEEILKIDRLAYTGGTILHLLLDGIASNFENDADAEVVLEILIQLEKTLIKEGVLSSDYVFCIAKK